MPQGLNNRSFFVREFVTHANFVLQACHLKRFAQVGTFRASPSSAPSVSPLENRRRSAALRNLCSMHGMSAPKETFGALALHSPSRSLVPPPYPDIANPPLMGTERNHDSQRRDRILRLSLPSEIGCFSPRFGVVSLPNYTENLEKIQEYQVETASRKCRFVSLVVDERALILAIATRCPPGPLHFQFIPTPPNCLRVLLPFPCSDNSENDERPGNRGFKHLAEIGHRSSAHL